MYCMLCLYCTVYCVVSIVYGMALYHMIWYCLVQCILSHLHSVFCVVGIIFWFVSHLVFYASYCM